MDTHWTIWSAFCRDLCCDPLLQSIEDPMPLLQIFASRYRVGILSPSRTAVKSRTVEGALRSVGQTIATLGYREPRLQPPGKLDIRLLQQLQAYSKEDPAPTRVKPIPLQVLQHIIYNCYMPARIP